MKIQSITVTAGRTFNHPYEQYSNLRPEVVMTATIGDGEDAAAATKELQQKAEGLVEDHKNHLLKSIRDLYQLTQARQEAIGLERQVKASQERLDEMRKANPSLFDESKLLANGSEQREPDPSDMVTQF